MFKRGVAYRTGSRSLGVYSDFIPPPPKFVSVKFLKQPLSTMLCNASPPRCISVPCAAVLPKVTVRPGEEWSLGAAGSSRTASPRKGSVFEVFSQTRGLRLFLTIAEWKREKKDRGKLQNYAMYQKWVTLDKSAVTSRRNKWALYSNLSPIKTMSLLQSQNPEKVAFPPIIHFLTLQFSGPNGINKAKP